MVLMVLVAGVCLFSFLRLVKAHQRIGGDYGDLGGELYGRSIKYAVYFFIVISQLGFVCSYFIFVAGNLVNVVQGLSQCRVQLPMSVWIWVPLAVLIPMVLVRHIAKLSLTAIVADVFILFGLISVLYFTGVQLKQAGAGPNIQAVNVDGFALMIGTAVFSFECVGLVIPLAESMAQPEKFPLVVWMGMIIVCIIYLVIGSISYIAYGDRIQAAVIYNFPPGNPLTMAVQLMYSIAVILSIPLMLFPAIKITESCLFYKCPSGTQSQAVKWGKNLFRCALTFLCAATAQFVGGDNLDKFVALVGSVACIPLCYVFPGMFHWKIAQKTSDKILDMALVALGVGLMAYTFWVAVDSFLQPMQPITKVQELCDAHHAIEG
ncbi:transmembrane amino acid transporter protein-domain-containing protein [Gongronella butleri]|nr:transmembrane amino acid transporter protein-domain-containing protein [Gongronella butleri]